MPCRHPLLSPTSHTWRTLLCVELLAGAPLAAIFFYHFDTRKVTRAVRLRVTAEKRKKKCEVCVNVIRSDIYIVNSRRGRFTYSRT